MDPSGRLSSFSRVHPHLPHQRAHATGGRTPYFAPNADFRREGQNGEVRGGRYGGLARAARLGRGRDSRGVCGLVGGLTVARATGQS